MPEINIQQVFADLQNFICNCRGEFIPEMPVGVTYTMSGQMMVKYTTTKVVTVLSIKEAAEIIQAFLDEQKAVQSVTEIKFIKVSFHNSDFSAGIRNALNMICTVRSAWINSVEQSVQRTREAIAINAAVYTASMEMMDHDVSEADNERSYKRYLDECLKDERLKVEFLTEAPKPSDKNVQWVYDVDSKSIYSQKKHTP